MPFLPAIPVDRYWRFVDQSAGDDACWPWIGSRAKGEYGDFYLSGRRRHYRAPRFAYAIAHGRIGAELEVRHTCDNPPCVNPSHLILGSRRENVGDMIARGRSLAGAANPSYKADADRLACGHIRRLNRTHCAKGCDKGKPIVRPMRYTVAQPVGGVALPDSVPCPQGHVGEFRRDAHGRSCIVCGRQRAREAWRQRNGFYARRALEGKLPAKAVYA